MIELFNTEMRRKLIALREELEAVANTGDEASQVVTLDQSTVGRLSRMDAMQAQAMSQASGRRRKAKLKMIDATLERIENDEFGLCLACGEPIARKRLEFDPTTLHCIDCARKNELAGHN